MNLCRVSDQPRINLWVLYSYLLTFAVVLPWLVSFHLSFQRNPILWLFLVETDHCTAFELVLLLLPLILPVSDSRWLLNFCYCLLSFRHLVLLLDSSYLHCSSHCLVPRLCECFPHSLLPSVVLCDG